MSLVLDSLTNNVTLVNKRSHCQFSTTRQPVCTPPHSGNFQAFFGPFGNLINHPKPRDLPRADPTLLDFWLATLCPANSLFFGDGSTISSCCNLSGVRLHRWNVTKPPERVDGVSSTHSIILRLFFSTNATVVPSGPKRADSWTTDFRRSVRLWCRCVVAQIEL